MRLLTRNKTGDLVLTDDLFEDIPPYAILSHTWSTNTSEEVSFDDIKKGTWKAKPAHRKLEFCGEQAGRDGLRYFWVDTCCIDKSTSDELQASINSMFRWYHDSARCYAYLSDVSTADQDDLSWEPAFAKSRWFTRGWTLQELLAPASVEFFSREGRRLGDKASLQQKVSNITKIPISALQRTPLSQFSVDERFSWAATRKTARPEDWAYCLLGIFGIFMPLIYGEGRDHAARRLRKILDDETEPEQNSKRCASFYIPFPRNRHFVGREDTLDKLRQMLFLQNECQRVAVVGLGGTGKTQVASELAYWVKANLPEYSVFWVPALSVATFEHAFAEIAMTLPAQQKSKDEDTKALVRRYLSSDAAGPWFLVVDNADDIELLFENSGTLRGIHEYLPYSEAGRTLFTTRSREVAVSVAGGDMVKLDEMAPQEAKMFLSKSLFQKDHLHDEPVVAELLDELTFLPLAIKQAAAYLNTNQISVPEYLRLLRSTETGLVELMSSGFYDLTRYGGSQTAVATTWIVSFEQICRSDSNAARLLSFISCIEPKAIPLSILPVLGSEEQMKRIIGKLCGHAFLERRGKRDVFDMHSLVHVAVRIWVEQGRRLEETETDAYHYLATTFSSANVADPVSWREYLPHALKVLRGSMKSRTWQSYDLFDQVGQCLLTDRRFKEAIGILEHVVAVRKRTLAEDDHSRLTSEHTLASAYLDDRRIKEAISIFEHVVAVRKRTLAEDDHFRLTSEHELARAYFGDRRIKEATSIFEHVVAVQKRTLAEDDHSRLTSEHALASTYLDDRRIKEAISIFEHVVAVERALPEDNHSRLTSEHELARAYLDDRRIKEAIRIFERVVAVQKRTAAKDDHSRLNSEHALARAYLDDGRIEEAISIFEYVVAARKRMLAEGDHDRLWSEHELARAYLGDQRIEEAITIFEHVVAVRKRTLPEDDHSRLASEHALASAYIDDGRIQEAISIFEHVVAVEKTLPEDDHSRLTSEHALASAYLDDGRIKKAIGIFEHVVAVEKALPEDDHSRLTSEHALARAYLDDERVEEAISIFEHVVAARKGTLDEDNHSRLTSEHALGRAYLDGQRTKEAIGMLEHVVAVRKRTLAEDDHSRLASQHTLASAYLDDGRTEEAISMLEHVVAVERTLPEDDRSRLTSEHELGRAYLDGRRTKEAIRILEHVVAVRKRTLPEDDHSRLTSEHELARAYLSDRRIKEATSMLEHVVAIQKTTLAEDDHSRLASEHTLASTYLDDGRIKEAISIFEHVVAVERALAEVDHSRLTSQHELARAYVDDGRTKEAISILEHVVAVRKRTLAEDDHSRLTSEHELARAYLDDERIKEAISIIEHVVAVRKRTLAEDDHSRLNSEHELARAYLDDERIKEAISIMEHVVAVRKRTLAEDDHFRLTSEYTLARALRAAE